MLFQQSRAPLFRLAALTPASRAVVDAATTGVALGDPSTVFDITLALRIVDLLGDAPAGRERDRPVGSAALDSAIPSG